MKIAIPFIRVDIKRFQKQKLLEFSQFIYSHLMQIKKLFLGFKYKFIKIKIYDKKIQLKILLFKNYFY